MESRPDVGGKLAELVIVHIVEVQQLRQCGPLFHQVLAAWRLGNRLQNDLRSEDWEIHVLGRYQGHGSICPESLWRVKTNIETLEGKFTYDVILSAIQQEEIQSVWDGIAINAQRDKSGLVDRDQVTFPDLQFPSKDYHNLVQVFLGH